MSEFTVPLARPRIDRRIGVPAVPRADLAAGLRVGAGFVAVFGTLWFVQGLNAAAGIAAAAAGLLPGLTIAAYLYRTRGAPARPPTLQGFLAQQYLNRATVAQLVVSVPGSVLIQQIAGPTAVLPFVIVTVGLYLLAIAPALRRWHVATAGLLLTVLPFVTVTAFDGPTQTAVTGIAGGAIFLLKGLIDLRTSRQKPVTTTPTRKQFAWLQHMEINKFGG